VEITIIHGQAHRGSTYHITELIRDSLVKDAGTVHEYYMPGDAPAFCVGCFGCIMKGEEKCPEQAKVQRIVTSMLASEIIIIDSPNYCFEMTGQLKTLMDHLAYMWMPHRPRKEMFSKIGIVISTAAGGGAGSVTKSLARQMFWWGVPRIHRVHFAVNASRWDEVPEQIRLKIIRKVEAVSGKINRQINKKKPDIRHLILFNIIRMMQQKNNWNTADRDYWGNNGWLGKARPWRNL